MHTEFLHKNDKTLFLMDIPYAKVKKATAKKGSSLLFTSNTETPCADLHFSLVNGRRRASRKTQQGDNFAQVRQLTRSRRANLKFFERRVHITSGKFQWWSLCGGWRGWRDDMIQHAPGLGRCLLLASIRAAWCCARACRTARRDLLKGEGREGTGREMFRFPVPISKDCNGLPPTTKTSRTLSMKPLEPMNFRSHHQNEAKQ